MKSLKLHKIYEKTLNQFGDNFKGMGWNNKKQLLCRYQVMSSIFINDKKKKTILDLGCGTSLFYEFLKKKKIKKFKYIGIDTSQIMVNISKKKFPLNKYYCVDILNQKKLPTVDYTIINGIFTQKNLYSNKEMLNFFEKFISKAYNITRKSLAFNSLSELSDWKNKKNFYLAFNQIKKIIKNKFKKKFILDHSYNQNEYTFFIIK
jgi:SAM-dependent methyltransferase